MRISRRANDVLGAGTGADTGPEQQFSVNTRGLPSDDNGTVILKVEKLNINRNSLRERRMRFSGGTLIVPRMKLKWNVSPVVVVVLLHAPRLFAGELIEQLAFLTFSTPPHSSVKRHEILNEARQYVVDGRRFLQLSRALAISFQSTRVAVLVSTACCVRITHLTQSEMAFHGDFLTSHEAEQEWSHPMSSGRVPERSCVSDSPTGYSEEHLGKVFEERYDVFVA